MIRPRMIRALVLLLALTATAWADQPATVPWLMAALAGIPARTQDFTETRTVHALAQPVRSRGTLAYARPDLLRKTTVAPRPEVLQASGDTLSIAAGGAPRTIDLAAAPPLRALVDAIRGTLSGNLELLQRSFRVSVAGTRASWTLSLAPRAAVRSLLSIVRVEGSGDVVRVVQVAQANGDQQVMRIAPPSPSR